MHEFPIETARLDRVIPGTGPGGDIWIFWASPVRFRGSLKNLAAVLAPCELERAARFYFETDRRLFTFSHGLLRLVLGHILDIPPSRVAIDRDRNGKPHLKRDGPGKKLSFNLSHSGEVAAIAVSMSEAVGVDVEKTGRISEPEGIIRRFFHPGEVSRFETLPEPDKLKWFYRMWTQKEAVIKAMGLGLSCPLDSFCIPDSNGGPCSLPADCGYREGTTFRFEPLEGYSGAGAILF